MSYSPPPTPRVSPHVSTRHLLRCSNRLVVHATRRATEDGEGQDDHFVIPLILLGEHRRHLSKSRSIERRKETMTVVFRSCRCATHGAAQCGTEEKTRLNTGDAQDRTLICHMYSGLCMQTEQLAEFIAYIGDDKWKNVVSRNINVRKEKETRPESYYTRRRCSKKGSQRWRQRCQT